MCSRMPIRLHTHTPPYASRCPYASRRSMLHVRGASTPPDAKPSPLALVLSRFLQRSCSRYMAASPSSGGLLLWCAGEATKMVSPWGAWGSICGAPTLVGGWAHLEYCCRHHAGPVRASNQEVLSSLSLTFQSPLSTSTALHSRPARVPDRDPPPSFQGRTARSPTGTPTTAPPSASSTVPPPQRCPQGGRGGRGGVGRADTRAGRQTAGLLDQGTANIAYRIAVGDRLYSAGLLDQGTAEPAFR
jgi:hypothetical protein